jgi:hypothetical protein
LELPAEIIFLGRVSMNSISRGEELPLSGTAVHRVPRRGVFNLFNRVNFFNPINLSLIPPAAGWGNLNVTSQGSFGVITAAHRPDRSSWGWASSFEGEFEGTRFRRCSPLRKVPYPA